MFKNCLKPVTVCKLCKKVGHVETNCTSKYKKECNQIDSSKIRCDNNLYVVTACIDHTLIIDNYLIDTGSCCTIIKHSLSRRLNISLTKTKEPMLLRCFMGNMISCNMRGKINVNIDESSGEVNAFILDDEYLQYDVIIGSDYLNQAHVAMFKFDNSLRLKNISTLHAVQGVSKQIGFDKIDFGDIGIFGAKKPITESLT